MNNIQKTEPTVSEAEIAEVLDWAMRHVALFPSAQVVAELAKPGQRGSWRLGRVVLALAAERDALRAERDEAREQVTHLTGYKIEVESKPEESAPAVRLAMYRFASGLGRREKERADRAEAALREAMEVIHAHRVHAPACGIYRGGEPGDCTCYLRAEVAP